MIHENTLTVIEKKYHQYILNAKLRKCVNTSKTEVFIFLEIYHYFLIFLYPKNWTKQTTSLKIYIQIG